jgi:hypothetical protein
MALNDYDSLIVGAANQYNVDPQLLKSIMSVESSGNPRAYNRSSGASGLMQFIPSTAQEQGVLPTDPVSSVYGGAAYLSELLTKYGSIDAALDHYSGGGGAAYGKKIIDAYHSVSPPIASGTGTQETKVTTAAAPQSGFNPDVTPPPGQRNANFNPPPTVADYPAVSNIAGSREQHAAASENLSSKGPAVMASATAPDLNSLPPEEQAIISGKPLPATAPAGAAPDTSALPPGEQQIISTAKPATQPPPPAPVPPTWWGRNVTAPLAAMADPSIPQPPDNNLLGQPWLQSLGAGVNQGVREVGTTLNHVDAYLAKNLPGYASLDKAIGYTPGQNDASDAAASKAYQEQYGPDWWAAGGRLAGNLLATAPVALPARALGAAAEALPVVGRYAAPALEWGTAGGAANAATSGGTTPADWARDFALGAAGGAALGAGGTLAGRVLLGAGDTAAQAIAKRLGIDLSTGQTGNATARWVEDTTAPFPGSGAGPFAQTQRQQIANTVWKEMGQPGEVSHITTPLLNQAEDRIGNAIESAAQKIDVPEQPLWKPLSIVENAATQAGPDTEQARTFRSLSTQLQNLAINNNGVIPGDQLAKFLARGGPIDTALGSSKQEVRAVGQGTKTALLDTAANNGNATTQQALDDLSNARYQWKVLQTVRPSMDKVPGGSEEMSLPALKNAIQNQFDMTQTGAGYNMQDLSRLLAGPLTGLPSSGTAERLLRQKILTGLVEGVGAAGAAGGSLFAGMPHVAAAAAAMPVVPALLGRALRYGPGLGITPLAAIQRGLNPLTARVAGGAVGNALLTPRLQPAGAQ